MRRNRCRSGKVGWYFAAFGLGLLISMICPKTVTVAILSVAIITLGVIIGK